MIPVFHNDFAKQNRCEKQGSCENIFTRKKSGKPRFVTASVHARHMHVLNELKDQFFLNMRHELSTPLTELKGYVELLRTHYTEIDAQTQMEFLNAIAHEGDELEQIMSNVLDRYGRRS